MKRRFAWLLAVLLMLALLCACAETKTASTEPYTVGSYTVTPINEKSGTITDGTNTYSYRYSTSGSGYSVIRGRRMEAAVPEAQAWSLILQSTRAAWS